MTLFEWFYKTVIAEGICVFLIIVSVVIIKYFFKNTFVSVQKFYMDNITADTELSEVLEGEI